MILSINDINKEVKLADDIISELGGVIFRKGTNLRITDVEILEAFGIKQVEIEEIKEGNIEKIIENNIKEEEYKNDNVSIEDFKKIFSESIKTVDKILVLAQGNAQIQILDLRKALQPLLNNKFIQPKFLAELRFISYNFDRYSSEHALSVGLLSYAISVWLDLDYGERMQIALAGTLHDVGMSRIPSHIIFSKSNFKSANYSDEYNEIKKHTLYGYQILKDVKGLNESSLLGVLQHHEREDGEGYPLNLKGSQINLYAKIIAIADVFHALTSRRTFREGYSFYQSLDRLTNEENVKLDQTIVKIFVKKITEFATGTKVLLSNDKEGYIIFINKDYPTRPVINNGNNLIDLVKEKDIFIKDVY